MSAVPQGALAPVIRLPVAGDRIDEIFGANGLLAANAREQGFPYEVREGQIQLARAVDRALRESNAALLEGPCGCHAAGQLVLLHDGSLKRVEDVVVGDRLMGADGQPRSVLSLARGTQEMVDVVPIKGESWRVNLDHVLTLVRIDNDRTIDVRVRDWFGWSKTQKALHKLFRVGVEAFGGQQERLLLNPRLLGILLGDGSITGTSGTVSVCKPDPEIVAFLRESALSLGLELHTAGITHRLAGPIGIKHHPIIAALRSLCLWRTNSSTKFIPHSYKTASREARLELLAGLLDTDGTLSSPNTYDYISKSERLANDVAFVARSLGFAAYVRAARKQCQTGASDIYHRVSISGDTEEIPCLIPRKRAAQRYQNKSVLRTGFEIVRAGTKEPFYGFSLDGDGRFLLGDFTVTHNTGKSIGYSAPLIRYLAEEKAAGRKKRAVIATATIALQEQLASKDLPALASDLPWAFTFALLKGRSNFLCHHRLNEWNDARESLWGEEAEQFRAIDQWANTSERGDKSELPFVPIERLWKRVTIESEDCLGKDCPNARECFYNKAKRAAAEADVVVTNYHVLCAELMLRDEGVPAEVRPLGEFDVLVCDEGHELPEVAREFFGCTFTPHAVKAAADRFRLDPKGKRTIIENNPQIASELEAAGDEWVSEMVAWARDRIETERAAHPERTFEAPTHNAVVESEHPASTRWNTALREALAVAERAKDRLDKREVAGNALTDDDKKIRAASRSFLRRYEKLVTWLAAFDRAGADPKANTVCWLEWEHAADRWKFEGRHVFVHEYLKRHLFSTISPSAAPGAIRSVIVCSATLTVGGKFDHMARELGAESAAIRLEVPSPFDFASRCCIVVPTGIPAPSAKGWQPACAAVLRHIVSIADGRTLGLFSSRSARDAAYRACRDSRRTWLLQGERTPRELAKQFKADARSVLFGTRSFWTGLDVPGDSLVAVVIDRIPFPNPADPVVARAHALLGKEAFSKWDLPRALMQLRQGFGRLIRTRTDWGVVVILDERVLSRSWGGAVFASLPRAKRLGTVAEVRGFFAAMRGAS